MEHGMEHRVRELAAYILATGDTVRGAAKEFDISKSTVHKDVTCRLEEIDKSLAEQVKTILEQHKEERHLRGGEATKAKYMAMKQGYVLPL